VGAVSFRVLRVVYETTETGFSLPIHGSERFTHFGSVPDGAGVDDENVPPNVCVTPGIAATVFTASLPSLVYSCW